MGFKCQRQLPVANQLERGDTHGIVEDLHPTDPGGRRLSDHQERHWDPPDLPPEIRPDSRAYPGLLSGLGDVAHLAAVDVGLWSGDSPSKTAGGDERGPIDGCPAADTGENPPVAGGQHGSQGIKNTASTAEASTTEQAENDSGCSADFGCFKRLID